MSDEDWVGRPDEPAEADDTSWFAPFADRTEPDGGPRSRDGSGPRFADGRRPLPPQGSAEPPSRSSDATEADGTRILPAVSDADATRADATRVAPATGRGANVDGGGVGRPVGGWPDVGRAEAAARAASGQAGGPDGLGDPVWSARAQVPFGRAGQGGHFTPTDWTSTEARPGRPWWTPILVGIVVMLLLGLLGFGVWLIMKGLADDDSPGSPVPTPATRQPTPEPTTEPTTEPTSPPTTTRSSVSPSATSPLVAVPPVAGLTAAQARRVLDDAGLSYRLILKTSANVPAGTVIGSDPFEGREVPAGTEVTLMVAVAPSPSASGGPSTSTDDSPDQGDEGADED